VCDRIRADLQRHCALAGALIVSRSRRGRGSAWASLRCRRLVAVLSCAVALTPAPLPASKPTTGEPLPQIGPAPAFTLTSQDGKRLSLRDLRGKVAVVTFIFTTCSDACPLLTAKLVAVERKLAAADPVFFVGITVDPLNDSPAVLKKYAEAYSAPPSRFAFLTGDFDAIQKVVRGYGVYYGQKETGGIEHTFLTSIVDTAGTLRVQYLGVRFDPDEFLADLRALIEEAQRR
jgi:protein SCO1/2